MGPRCGLMEPMDLSSSARAGAGAQPREQKLRPPNAAPQEPQGALDRGAGRGGLASKNTMVVVVNLSGRRWAAAAGPPSAGYLVRVRACKAPGSTKNGDACRSDQVGGGVTKVPWRQARV